MSGFFITNFPYIIRPRNTDQRTSAQGLDDMHLGNWMENFIGGIVIQRNK